MLATGGLYAPTIRCHNGTVYVVCTNVIISAPDVDHVHSNFIVSTTDIWSDNWSDPVFFQFKGIDPSIFFDDDGRTYMQGSASPGPMTKIHLFEIDLKTGEKLSEEKKIWDGTGGIYPEGPHLYKKDGLYYLLISEGGTHDGHMITVARSKDIWGPYESYEKNPILTAAGTDEYIQYTGHCDMFQGQSGEWWGVCLGVRKDGGGRFIMGRETFLTPGAWREGEWPSLERVKATPRRMVSAGGATLKAKPTVDFVYIRDVDLGKYQFSSTPEESITLTPSPIDLADPIESPTFVGKRQRQLTGTSTVTLETGGGPSIKAGLAVYKDEHRFLRIQHESSSPSSAVVVELRNNAKKIHRTTRHECSVRDGEALDLQLTYTEQEYRVGFKGEGAKEWQTVATFDTMDLTGPDFVGPVVGVFAVSVGDGPPANVHFRNLKIE